MLINPYVYAGYGDFPVIHSATTSKTTSGTTHTLDMPGGIQNGDLLMVLGTVDESPTVTWPSGWTNFGSNSGSTANTSITKYRIADGTESSATFTTSTSQASVVCVLQIGNWHGTTAPEAIYGTSGPATTTPNTSSRTASWGSANNLWLSVIMLGGITTPDTWPTNYTYFQYAEDSGGGVDADDVTLFIAARQLAAGTENPGGYTIASAKYWLGETVVVRPK